MNLKEAILAEFDAEVAVTRKVFDRLPGESFGWKPHERSMSLGGLDAHLAQIPHWGTTILERDGYDMPPNAQGPGDRGSHSKSDVIETFDRHVTEVRRTLLGMTDAELYAPWSLTSGGDVVMSLPKIAALRRFLLNHLVHHRGQLTVYLRMHNVPLPPLYGPTADEGM